jgi:hypothetical protein
MLAGLVHGFGGMGLGVGDGSRECCYVGKHVCEGLRNLSVCTFSCHAALQQLQAVLLQLQLLLQPARVTSCGQV